MVLVESHLALVEFTDPALDGLEFRLAAWVRVAASSMAMLSRETPSSIDSTRARAVSTFPASRARPSRRSASACTAAMCARSASVAGVSFSTSSVRVAPSLDRAASRSASSSRSWAAIRSASASISSGSGPVVAVGSVSRYWARSVAMRTVAPTRSASAESRNHVCWAASVRSDSDATAASSASRNI